jgi:hypothetical protein
MKVNASAARNEHTTIRQMENAGIVEEAVCGCIRIELVSPTGSGNESPCSQHQSSG